MQDFDKIFQKIISNANEDTKINLKDLENHLFKNISTKQQYINDLHLYKNKFKKIENSMLLFYTQMYKNYKNSEYKEYNDKEIKLKIEDNEDYNNLKYEKEQLEQIINLLKDTIENLKDKSFTLKNIIDYFKIKHSIDDTL